MKEVNIDLDSRDIANMLLTYFKSQKIFLKSKISVEVSSSGSGFHILIPLSREISFNENIKYRALLNDCSERIRLSITKNIMNDKEEHDLIFTEKAGKKVKIINMELIFKPHSELINQINENWETNKALELIEILAKKIERKIPLKKGYVTSIGIKGKVLLERLKKIAGDIYIKDKTFKYRFFNSYFPKSDYIFCVFSKNKNQAMQRGAWVRRVIKKELNKEILYYVKKI